MSQRECSWSTARELSKWESTFFYLHDFYPDNVTVAFERLVEGLGLLEVSLVFDGLLVCLLYTSPSPRDLSTSRMPSSA